MRVAVVSCHEYGRAVTLGALRASDGEWTLSAVVTGATRVGQRLLGTRFDALGDLATSRGANHVVTNDLSLAELVPAELGNPDIVMVAGWPKLITVPTLTAIKEACPVIGFHPSLLPHGKGMSPIQWAILEATGTGVSAFCVVPEPDGGALLGQTPIELSGSDTAGTLYAKCLLAHHDLARSICARFALAGLTPTPQNQAIGTYRARLPPTARQVALDQLAHDAATRRQWRAWSAPYGWARTVANGATRAVLSVSQAGEPILSRELITDESELAYNVGVMGDATLDSKLEALEPTRAIARRYSGVVLANQSGNVYLQRRDNDRRIVNPGMITLFGGVAEPDELPAETACRELSEELGLSVQISDLVFLGWVDKVERDATTTRCAIFQLTRPDIDSLAVHEGQGFVIGTPEQLLAEMGLSAVARLALETYIGFTSLPT